MQKNYGQLIRKSRVKCTPWMWKSDIRHLKLWILCLVWSFTQKDRKREWEWNKRNIPATMIFRIPKRVRERERYSDSTPFCRLNSFRGVRHFCLHKLQKLIFYAWCTKNSTLERTTNLNYRFRFIFLKRGRQLQRKKKNLWIEFLRMSSLSCFFLPFFWLKKKMIVCSPF